MLEHFFPVIMLSFVALAAVIALFWTVFIALDAIVTMMSCVLENERLHMQE